MTVNELYTLTKEIMFEKSSSTIYNNYLVGNLNRLLVELYNDNNMIRAFKGLKFLDAPQVIPSTDYSSVELTYEDEIVKNVLPLGLAARFMIDDDLNKYTLYNNDYLNAKTMFAQKLVSKEKLEDAAN